MNKYVKFAKKYSYYGVITNHKETLLRNKKLIYFNKFTNDKMLKDLNLLAKLGKLQKNSNINFFSKKVLTSLINYKQPFFSNYDIKKYLKLLYIYEKNMFNKNFSSNEFSSFVPFNSYQYSLLTQQFLIYTESLHTLYLMNLRSEIYNSKVRKKQDFYDIYKSYVFPFYRYYRRLYETDFNDEMFIFKISNDRLLGNTEINKYYFLQNFEEIDFFTEYFFDDELEYSDSMHFTTEQDDEGETEGDHVLSNDVSDYNEIAYSEEDDSEEDVFTEDEDSIDFFIPGETYCYSNYITLIRDEDLLFNFDLNNLFCEKIPLDFYNFINTEENDDLLLINNSFWVLESLVDKFLIDISEKDDFVLSSDFLILSKISQYGENIFDENILNNYSNISKLSFIKFINSLKITRIGYFTFKLKELNNISYKQNIFLKDKDDFISKSVIKPMQSFQSNISDQNQLVNNMYNNRIYIYLYHPYLDKIINKTYKIKIIPIIGSDIINNDFKIKFFKNSRYYIKLLNLKHYPDLTIQEANRLFLFLGCNFQEWNSISKKKSSVVLPFDSLDFPLLVTLVSLFLSFEYWFRYMFFDNRFYRYNFDDYPILSSFLFDYLQGMMLRFTTLTTAPFEYYYAKFFYVDIYINLKNSIDILFNFLKLMYKILLNFSDFYLTTDFIYSNFSDFFFVKFILILFFYLKISFFVKYSLVFVNLYELLNLYFYFIFFYFSFLTNYFYNFFYYYNIDINLNYLLVFFDNFFTILKNFNNLFYFIKYFFINFLSSFFDNFLFHKNFIYLSIPFFMIIIFIFLLLFEYLFLLFCFIMKNLNIIKLINFFSLFFFISIFKILFYLMLSILFFYSYYNIFLVIFIILILLILCF